MDGQNQRVIMELTEDSHPSGMTVHHNSANQSRLYFTDRFTQEVYYIDLDSNSSYTIPFISSEIIEPIDLTIFGNNLYLTDAGGSGPWDGGVYSALLGGPGNVSKVIDLMKNAWGITSYDLDSIPPSGTGSLTHLCHYAWSHHRDSNCFVTEAQSASHAMLGS